MDFIKIDPFQVFDALRAFLHTIKKEPAYPYYDPKRTGWHLLVPKYLIEPLRNVAYNRRMYSTVWLGNNDEFTIDGFKPEPGYENKFVLFKEDAHYGPIDSWDKYIFSAPVPVLE